MYLINVRAFLSRENSIVKGKDVDYRTEVVEFCDDEAKEYAILSHRWIGKEVKYEEMVELTEMDTRKRDEIRQRDGYKKILHSCAQAERDGYEWLWIDACCIDKRSSAELSEAINSMYRWYENSRVCYAYLHDVSGSSFPIVRDEETYPDSNGYPVWFSRGWTLQEMIAPNDLRFFNKDWQPIGDKRTLSPVLASITRVPQHILTDGLSGNRPCVAQIMTWFANRRTTRVEDKAYSLMGLLDVNMPMLYGEGKKAFQRLQLEIIRMSNDHSIFAWHCRGEKGWTGSILADDPSYFRDCSTIELVDHDEFIQQVKGFFPEENLHSIDTHLLDVFPVTNSWLPCRSPSKGLMFITLALQKSYYYRWRPLTCRQVYLRYQDTPHRGTTFEIDDSAITQNGLRSCGTYPSKLTQNTLTLTSTNPLCVKVYSDMGFGQWFGQAWIHVVCEEHASRRPWENYAKEQYHNMLAKGAEHAIILRNSRSLGGHYPQFCVRHTDLPGSTWTVRTSCVMWKSGNRGVKVEAFQYPSFCNISSGWIGFDVEGTDDPNCDMRGLMIRDSKSEENQCKILVDGISMKFSPAPDGIRLGDYGHFTDSDGFRQEGNIFTLLSQAVVTPMKHEISSEDGYNIASNYVTFQLRNGQVNLYNPVGLSLPRDLQFNSWLASLSTRLTDKHLVKRVIHGVTQYPSGPTQYRYPRLELDLNDADVTTPLCTISKPFVWHRSCSV
ncbi:heterokaryon incompatibility protein-domain-containing protein [Scleroderma yunnanense]